MNEVKELVEELRNKKSRDNRELFDRSADMIEELAKELCKEHCHHLCHDTKDCVVEDEAELLISDKSQCIDCIHNEICQFYNALGAKVICYPCGFYEAKEVIANSATTKEKQIEEMCEVLRQNAESCKTCSWREEGLCVGNCELAEENQAVCEALYTAGYRKQSEWISVKDRLPNPYETVLVFCRIGFKTFECVSEMLDVDGGRWSATCGIPVTHWMPLPEAPKMKGGE